MVLVVPSRGLPLPSEEEDEEDPLLESLSELLPLSPALDSGHVRDTCLQIIDTEEGVARRSNQTKQVVPCMMACGRFG